MSGPTRPLGPTKPLPPPGGSRDPNRSLRYELRVMSGPETGACIVTDGRVIVGSSPEATFQVTDDAVSRQHLEVNVRPEGARVTDLNSTNGTFLAGARIQQMTVFEEAHLTVGTTVLRVSRMAQDFDQRPPARTSFGKVVGRAEAMQQLFRQLDKA